MSGRILRPAAGLGLPTMAAVLLSGGAPGDLPPVRPQPPTLHIGAVSTGQEWLPPPALMEDSPESWVMRQVQGPGLMRAVPGIGAYARTALATDRIEGVRRGRLIFTIPPDLRYHDGTPVTVDDFRATYGLYSRLARDGDPQVDAAFAYLDSVILAADLDQLDLVMPGWASTQLDRLATTAPLPEAAVRGLEGRPDEVRARLSASDRAAGLGAYRMRILPPTEDRNGQVLTVSLEGVDRSVDGSPQIRDVVIHFYRSDAQLIQAFVTGRVQVAWLPTYSSLEDVINQSRSRVRVVPRNFVRKDHWWFLAMNNTDRDLSSVAVRSAVSHALVDREQFMEARAPLDVRSDVLVDPSDDIGISPARPRGGIHARRLLQEAGYRIRSGLTYSPGGRQVTFDLLYPEHVALYERIARQVKNHLFSIGIDVTPIPVAPRELRNRLYSGEYQMALWQITVPPTAESLYRLFRSENAQSGANFTRYRNRNFDTNMAAYLRPPGQIADPGEYLQGALQRLQADVPLIPLFKQGSIYVAFDALVVEQSSIGPINQLLQPLARWRIAP